MRDIETFRMTRSVSQISGIEAHRMGDVETFCMRRPVSQISRGGHRGAPHEGHRDVPHDEVGLANLATSTKSKNSKSPNRRRLA